jgi:outer membrane protein
MKNTAKLLLIPALLACAAAAQAQSGGSFLIRGGVTTITPSVSSGDLTPPSLFGTKSAIGASTRLSGGLTYMLDDNIAIDLPLAVPFEHDITGDGAIAGAGKIGSVKALPATLLAQWRFMDYNSTIRPYIGAGVTYAKFYGARSTSTLTAISGGTPSNPTTLEVESKWAAALQLGASIQMGGGWFIDANYVYSPLSTRTTLSTGQTLDAKLDPSAVSLTVGFKY